MKKVQDVKQEKNVAVVEQATYQSLVLRRYNIKIFTKML